MTLQVSQSIVQAGTTPSPLTPASSDTIAAASFGPNGLIARVITTGTVTTVSVQDPGTTAMSNAGTVAGVTMPSTGVRMVAIPIAAINPASQQATVLFSGALTGVTYELYRY